MTERELTRRHDGEVRSRRFRFVLVGVSGAASGVSSACWTSAASLSAAVATASCSRYLCSGSTIAAADRRAPRNAAGRNYDRSNHRAKKRRLSVQVTEHLDPHEWLEREPLANHARTPISMLAVRERRVPEAPPFALMISHEGQVGALHLGPEVVPPGQIHSPMERHKTPSFVRTPTPDARNVPPHAWPTLYGESCLGAARAVHGFRQSR